MNKNKLSAVFFIISLLASCSPTSTDSGSSEKSVLVSYTIYVDGCDELINCLEGYSQPNFILYDNGQLVVYKNGQYQETALAQEGINSLLDEIERTGILQLGKIEVEGFDQLIVKGNTYHFPHPNFPNKSLEQTVEIIDKFQPSNLKPYIPEDLLLWNHPIESIELFEDYLPKPIPEVKEWSTELDSLSKIGVGFENIGKESLPKVMRQFDGFPDYQIFKEENNLYIGAICANFP